MKNTTWNTYRTVGYSYDVAQDQRSAGGVHHHQIRRTPGGWQHRIKQTNGRFVSYGAISHLSNEEGEATYAIAKSNN